MKADQMIIKIKLFGFNRPFRVWQRVSKSENQFQNKEKASVSFPLFLSLSSSPMKYKKHVSILQIIFKSSFSFWLLFHVFIIDIAPVSKWMQIFRSSFGRPNSNDYFRAKDFRLLQIVVIK